MSRALRTSVVSLAAILTSVAALLTAPSTAPGAESSGVPVIHLLFLYTPAAMEQAGSAPPVQRMVDEANSVFLNSAARARIRLVHMAKVAYQEPPISDTFKLQLTLERLVDPRDGYLDEAHLLRAQYGADIVVLLTEDIWGYSGQDGFLAPLRPNTAHAFGVLTSTSDYAFTRLLGRLLGCEAQQAPLEETWRVVGEGAFPDSHACIVSNRTGQVYSTIMGARTTLLPVFSNPDVVRFGSLMGISGSADNVRTINLVAPEMAGFSGITNWVTPPEVQWVFPASGALFSPGADIPLQVAATSSTAVVQKVEFYKADSPQDLTGRLLFTDFTPGPAGHFDLTLTNAAAGWYHISARATDSSKEIGQASIEFRVRAPNDDFADRIQLQTATDRVPLDLAGMSLEPGEEPLAAPGVEATAWYTWTAPDNGYLEAKALPDYSWYLSPWVRAYSGTNLATLASVGGSPDRGSPLLLPVNRGDTVQLSVGCGRNEVVPAELVTAFLPPLTNDSFESRVAITGLAAIIAGHNVGARSSTIGVSGPTVWWSWTPSLSGIAQLQASNFAPNQVISVYQGNQPDTLTLLSQLIPSYSGSVGQGFPVQAGLPLQVTVTSPTGFAAGSFVFRVTVLPTAPNNNFATRLSRTAADWAETLVFPGVPGTGVPAGVGPYAAWWQWTAPQDGTAMLTVSGWGVPKVSVFTGDSLATLQPAQTIKAGAGLAVFPVTAGAKYQLALSWDSIPYYLGAGFAPVLHFGYAPANDSFAQRMPLNGAPVGWGLTNAFGTTESGEPTSSLASWWYSWVAPARGRVTLSVTGSVSVVAFRGSSLGQLTNVMSQRYWDPLPNFLAEPGVEYQIAIQSGDLSSLPASAHIFLQLQLPPANDDFALPQILTGSDHLVAADLELATAGPGDPVVPNRTNPRTLWWKWFVPADGVASFSSSSSALGIYRGSSVGSLTPLTYCWGAPTFLPVTAGEVLYLLLAGDGYYSAGFRVQLLPGWGNDSFLGRAAVAPVNGNPLALRADGATTQGATREAGESLSSTNAAGHSRWWTWQTPVPAMAKVLVTPSTGRVSAEQFRGSQLSGLRSVYWQETPFPTLRFHAEPGIEYPLAVDSLGTNEASFSISVDLLPDPPAPANDFFAHAQVLEGPAAKGRSSHRTATAEPGDPAHGGLAPARSLWWRWTAPQTGRVRLSAKPISSDAAAPLESYPPGTLAFPHRPGLAIYTGDSLSALQEQASWEVATTNALEAAVEFDALASQSYAVALDGGDPGDADVGEFELQLIQLPTNDDFASRIALQDSVAVLSGTVFGSTRPTNEWVAQWPSSSANTSLMNVWWQWTAPADLRVTLRNLHPNEHFWGVWRGGDSLRYPPRCSVMDRYFGWEDTRRDFIARAGEVWYIAVYANPANTTPVEIELEGVPVPINDDFAGRIPLSGERVCLSTRGDNTSREPNEPPHGLNTVGLPYGKSTNAPSLWWSWTAPRSGLFAFTTEAQAALQSELAGPWDEVVRADCFVYEGNQLTNLVRLAGTAPDTTSPPTGMKRVVFAATAGATYPIALCPIFVEKRIWDTAKYFVDLAIDPVTENSSPETAFELVGWSPAFSGNLRAGVDGLWWRWTAPDSGIYRFAQRLGGADVTRQLLFQAYRRDPATSNLVSCDIYAPAEGGETYWFKVTVLPLNWWETSPAWDGRDLPFDAALALTIPPTTNDNFAQRALLSGVVAALVGDNTGATRESGEPLHAGALGHGSLWWQWTAPHSGRWTLATQRAPWGPLLVDVYRGNTLTTLQRVPTERNALRQDLIFQAQAGETYVIAIDNPSYPTGPVELQLFESLPPPNDAFAGRLLLNGAAPAWTGRNIGASAEVGEPDHAGCAAEASAWWTWTAQTSSQILVSLSNGDSYTSWLPPRAAVYRGDSLQGLTTVAHNRIGGELLSTFTFHADAGVTYSLALDTPSQETGVFRLALTPTNAPPNDDFARRFTLMGSQVQTVAFNYGATLEPGEPNPQQPPAGATLWWQWTASGTGPTTIDTTGSTFDTCLAVYQGTSLPSLVLVAGNDDAATVPGSAVNFASRLTFDAHGGTTYQIQVGSVMGGYGLVALTVLGPNPPPAQLLSAEIYNWTCQLRLRGTPGQTVWIERSSDLLTWQGIGSVRFLSSDAVWSEPIDAGVAARFYRLVSPP
ncbi:MAG TPA: Ig-like domain-containing protein [Verrucomicrobiae bacterium]